MAFRNEPLIDFSVAEERARFQAAVDALDARVVTMSLVAGPIIGGKELSSPEKFERYDPSDPHDLIGTTSFATAEHCAAALASVSKGASGWRRTPIERRCEILRRVAALMRRDRLFLAALIIREAGKPWKEADADVAEAIDFCEYYADGMERLTARRTEDLVGEENVLRYEPRGVGAIISPWNFPLAIACGMTAAALVSGNTAILKPAEQTSVITCEFSRLLLEAGVPPDAYAFLPGWGEQIGRELVRSPLVQLIAFTGSKSVGLEILRSAAELHEGQLHIKRVIAELGGKNAVIVDEDADLDEAIKGVLYSAFGFSGQKCSACSRVIAVGSAYEPFMERLSEAAAALIVGKACDPATYIGPVIDEESRGRIAAVVDQHRSRERIAFEGSAPREGSFVAPIIFRDVRTESSLWREEVFGPVLAARSAPSFDEALRIANESQYGLTGGVFSRSPANIALAKERFEVGNLYINRGCTGAMVGRQPFGGFKLSGIGSKAGGPDYLLQFVEPRTVTENTMRRGFAPEGE